jgi:GrpB-like predicted nucleotidyltransferase (UPF0157 family)
MGLPDPDDAPAYDGLLPKLIVGTPEGLAGPVVLSDYDASWRRRSGREASRIAAALGADAIRIEHVGSTSIPHLPAKPIIDIKPIVDIVLEVSDSTSKSGYVPRLDASGYWLAIREPDWLEHRMFKAAGGGVELRARRPGANLTNAPAATFSFSSAWDGDV